MIVLYLILALMVLLLMVLVHEFGHYVIGRMLNFKINEFSIGFGKAIFSKKNKRGELISLRIFPLGGYCAFAGEDDVDGNKADSFNNQKPWKRILVYLAGITFNFAFAVITSAILLCTIGYDIPQVKNVQLNTTKITGFIDNSLVYGYDPNESLQVGDVVLSVDGKKIDFAYGENYTNLITNQFKEYGLFLRQEQQKADENGLTFDEKASFEAFYTTHSYSAIVKRNGQFAEAEIGFAQIATNQKVKDEKGDIVYEEDGVTAKTEKVYLYLNNGISGAYQIKVTKGTDGWKTAKIEIIQHSDAGTVMSAYVHSVGEAIERAVPFSFGLAWTVLKSLWQMITFQLPLSSLGGPITTIATIAQVAQANFSYLLILIPLISANLAIFNLLPIPALDGAHVVFTTIEAIRKKPIKREVENMIHTVGLFILLGFVVLVDILHFLL